MELTLGEKIRLLREERELNQTQLGEALNMTQRKISYLEHNTYEPGVEDLQALCRFFHVSADYLLGFPEHLPYPRKRK
jgi:transcriptional regulator with XRE-family HTH domain